MDKFNIYKETELFQQIVDYSGLSLYFFIILSFLYILRTTLIFNKKILLTNTTIITSSFFITLLNYFNIYYIGVIELNLIYIISSIYCYQTIEKKSIKWINISLLLFYMVVINVYILFNEKLNNITELFFRVNDFLYYNIDYKPYLKIFSENEFKLHQIDFMLDNNKIIIKDTSESYRIYMFLYVLNNIAIIFWLLVYIDMLKKHAIYIEKLINKNNTWKDIFFFDIQNSYLFKTKQNNKEKIKEEVTQNNQKIINDNIKEMNKNEDVIKENNKLINKIVINQNNQNNILEKNTVLINIMKKTINSIYLQKELTLTLDEKQILLDLKLIYNNEINSDILFDNIKTYLITNKISITEIIDEIKKMTK